MFDLPLVIHENALSIWDTFESDLVKADEYAKNAKSKNTIKAYLAALKNFASYCGQNGLEPIPMTTDIIRGYISNLAKDHKYATIRNRLVLIGVVFKRNGYDFPLDDPKVKDTIEGIKREIGVRQNKKAPLLMDDIKKALSIFSDSLLDTRNKALLLLGWAGAFRRSELVNIDVEDIDFSDARGIIILLKRSKTDQSGEGQTKAIPYTGKVSCPIKALKNWLEASNIKEGAIFRPINRANVIQDKRLSDKAVSRLVKTICEKVGLDSDRFSGHSLRAGMATQSALNGGTVHQIMSVTGHKKADTTMGYIRNSDPFRNSPLLLTDL